MVTPNAYLLFYRQKSRDFGPFEVLHTLCRRVPGAGLRSPSSLLSASLADQATPTAAAATGAGAGASDRARAGGHRGRGGSCTGKGGGGGRSAGAGFRTADGRRGRNRQRERRCAAPDFRRHRQRHTTFELTSAASPLSCDRRFRRLGGRAASFGVRGDCSAAARDARAWPWGGGYGGRTRVDTPQ